MTKVTSKILSELSMTEVEDSSSASETNYALEGIFENGQFVEADDMIETSQEENSDNSIDSEDLEDSDVEVDDTSNQDNEEEIDSNQPTDMSEYNERISSLQDELESYKSKLEKASKQDNEANALYNYLRSKPELLQLIYDTDANPDGANAPEVTNKYEEQIQELQMEMRKKEIMGEISEITSKDSEVTKEELLQIAHETGTTIKGAYGIWKSNNLDKIIEKRLAEKEKQLTEKIKTNRETTKTVMSKGSSANSHKKDSTHGLTPLELDFAKKMGMSAKEYAKWKK